MCNITDRASTQITSNLIQEFFTVKNIPQKGARVQIVNRRADNSSEDPGKTMLSSQQPHCPAMCKHRSRSKVHKRKGSPNK